MKVDQLPNLRAEDFPSEQSWIPKLFVMLNPFIQAVYQAFNNNVDYSTNIKSVTKEYSITTFQEFGFLWTFTDSTPNDVRIVKASKGTQQDPCILLLAWEYDSSTKVVTITRIVEVLESSVGELSGSYKFMIRATV